MKRERERVASDVARSLVGCRNAGVSPAACGAGTQLLAPSVSWGFSFSPHIKPRSGGTIVYRRSAAWAVGRSISPGSHWGANGCDGASRRGPFFARRGSGAHRTLKRRREPTTPAVTRHKKRLGDVLIPWEQTRSRLRRGGIVTKSRKQKSGIVRWALILGVPLVLAGVALTWVLWPSGPTDLGPTLFIIQRSTNANEVHYEVQADANGELGDEPVVAYWVMKAEGGGREDLTYFEEEMAYGFEVLEPEANGEREMKLVAWEDRKIRLVKDEDGNWRAVTTIDGEEAYLTRLYIETDESGLTPSVVHVDIFGETVDGGDPIEERVVED